MQRQLLDARVYTIEVEVEVLPLHRAQKEVQFCTSIRLPKLEQRMSGIRIHLTMLAASYLAHPCGADAPALLDNT
jgi:hypothetical protein